MKEFIFELERVASLLELNERIKREVSFLIWKAFKNGITKGRERERTIACLIYYISKRDPKFSISIKEISEKLGIEKFSLLRTYRKIMRKMKLKGNKCDFSSLIYKYGNLLELPPFIVSNAEKIYTSFNNVNAAPLTKIAISLFIACQKKGFKKSIWEIAEKCNVSKTTVRKFVKKLPSVFCIS